MSILPFKKNQKKEDINQQLVNDLRGVRTKLKQLKLKEDKLKEEMDNAEIDYFLYDINDEAIAKLSVTHSNGIDTNSIKEAEPEICAQHMKETTRRTWYLL